MKKFAMILACMLACCVLFSGCKDKKNNGDQELGNSVEIDDTDLEIDTEGKPDSEEDSDSVSLPDGFTYSFKDPDHADGIVVTPRE